jgi:A/G-specific adenine glycosylase
MTQSFAHHEAATGFAPALLTWHRRFGRHDLPWQNTTDPYRVWLSEIMLQQTQVNSVVPYYRRFLAHFDSLDRLACAQLEDVMCLWSGLGYYARARNVWRCAQMIAQQGRWPQTPEALASLPGIGRSTAHALMNFCFGGCLPILDGNVKRVLSRVFTLDDLPGSSAGQARFWALAHALIAPVHPRDSAAYTQAQMDLGALVCTPRHAHCLACPLSSHCGAYAQGTPLLWPARKERKVLPQRHATVLWLCHEDQVLLQRRPPQGIWGGLASLPEINKLPTPDPVDAAHALLTRWRLSAHHWTILPTVAHGFTHFQLHISPLYAQVQTLAPPAGDWPADLYWCPKNQLHQAALPAPIRRLLLSTQGIPVTKTGTT